jgi:hypothetical protein
MAAPILTLRDDFEDNAIAAAWDAVASGSATVAETGGQARFTLPSSTAGSHVARYISNVTYDLTGGSFFSPTVRLLSIGLTPGAYYKDGTCAVTFGPGGEVWVLNTCSPDPATGSVARPVLWRTGIVVGERTGPTGPQGMRGLAGAASPQGLTGSVEPKGDRGLMGPQGQTGPSGPVEPAGAADSALIVRIETLERQMAAIGAATAA